MRELISSAIRIVSYLVELAIALALFCFLWGLAKSVLNGSSEEAREEGRRTAKWGLIALFVMLSVWGIVAFIQKDLGLPAGTLILPGGRLFNAPFLEISVPAKPAPKINTHPSNF